MAWQEKYAADILAPWGLTQGSGYVFTTSLAKIKEIHEANCATGSTTVPTIPSLPPQDADSCIGPTLNESCRVRLSVSPEAQCLSTAGTLSLGMRGDAVVAAQQLLKTLGYFPADVDTTGYFGPITRTATIDFQAANGIDQLGIIGPQTRASFNELGCV